MFGEEGSVGEGAAVDGDGIDAGGDTGADAQGGILHDDSIGGLEVTGFPETGEVREAAGEPINFRKEHRA